MQGDLDTLPEIMQELHKLEFDYDGGDGIDFEPYAKFMSLSETEEWLKAWTGNEEADGTQFRVFGQDGSGGYAALWLVRDGMPITEAPVVFLGSEGEAGVVARSLADYLWLLAGGVGPAEAVVMGMEEGSANPGFLSFARTHAPGAEDSPRGILEAARAEFPGFADQVEKMCR